MGDGSGEDQDIYQRKKHAIVEDWDREKKERVKHGSRRRGNTEYMCLTPCLGNVVTPPVFTRARASFVRQ